MSHSRSHRCQQLRAPAAPAHQPAPPQRCSSKPTATSGLSPSQARLYIATQSAACQPWTTDMLCCYATPSITQPATSAAIQAERAQMHLHTRRGPCVHRLPKRTTHCSAQRVHTWAPPLTTVVPPPHTQQPRTSAGTDSAGCPSAPSSCTLKTWHAQPVRPNRDSCMAGRHRLLLLSGPRAKSWQSNYEFGCKKQPTRN